MEKNQVMTKELWGMNTKQAIWISDITPRELQNLWLKTLSLFQNFSEQHWAGPVTGHASMASYHQISSVVEVGQKLPWDFHLYLCEVYFSARKRSLLVLLYVHCGCTSTPRQVLGMCVLTRLWFWSILDLFLDTAFPFNELFSLAGYSSQSCLSPAPKKLSAYQV